MGKKNKKNKNKKQQSQAQSSQLAAPTHADNKPLKPKLLTREEGEKLAFFDASQCSHLKSQYDLVLKKDVKGQEPMNYMEEVYLAKYEPINGVTFQEVPNDYYHRSSVPVASAKKAHERFTTNVIDESAKGFISFANLQPKVDLPNAWGNQQPDIGKFVFPKEEVWPEQKKVNDWDIVADPEIAKAKNQGEYIKKKFFAGDYVAVWYTNDFYVGKITHISPKVNQATVHIPYWDYEKDKEEKHVINLKPDQIYCLHTFDTEGREHKSDIGWRVGDFCWAWLAEERDYYAAWYQGPNRNNLNDQDVVFDTYEDDGMYVIPRHFVIPPYMFDERYLDYHIDGDLDVVVDQSKTQCEKLARILRRARRLRKQRGENKYYYEEEDCEGGSRWKGVVGRTSTQMGIMKL